MKDLENKAGYKKTKLGWIPEDWEIKRVEEISDRIRESVSLQPDQWYQEIGIRSHAKGIFIKEPKLGETLGKKSCFWIQPDCLIINIVFAWEQAIAKTTKELSGLIASHRFPMFRMKEDKADLDYILYFFKTLKGKYYLGLASPGGAGRNKTLGQKAFAELKLALPPFKQQQNIAKILLAWDKAIKKTTSLIKEKENLKKGLMQQLFSQQLRFLDDNGEEFPAWETTTLGKIAVIRKGFTPSTKNASYWKGQNKWLSIRDMKQGKFITNTSKKITDLAIKGKSVVQKNTLIMSFKLTLGKLAITRCPIFTNEAICNFEWKRNTISTEYMYYFLNSINIASFGSKAIKGITLNNDSLKAIVTKLPIFKEQQKIANCLTTLDQEIQNLRQQKEQLQLQKKGLMQQLLTGRVRVVLG